MTEKQIEETTEASGRTVEIDTGFYRVQVWGDPDDSFADVLEAADHAADRAKRDCRELDDDDPGGGYE